MESLLNFCLDLKNRIAGFITEAFRTLHPRKPEPLANIRQRQSGEALRDKRRPAAELFRGPEKYNCLQAVLLAYQHRYVVTAADIAAAGKMGGGKVPGGYCGALYAGRLLLNEQRQAEELTRRFEAVAGAARCKEILKLKKINCKECVVLTERLLGAVLAE